MSETVTRETGQHVHAFYKRDVWQSPEDTWVEYYKVLASGGIEDRPEVYKIAILGRDSDGAIYFRRTLADMTVNDGAYDDGETGQGPLQPSNKEEFMGVARSMMQEIFLVCLLTDDGKLPAELQSLQDKGLVLPEHLQRKLKH